MNFMRHPYWTWVVRNKNLRSAIFLVLIFFMGNLNALVDKIYKPEIPYFSNEHLIVGIMTASVSTILFGLLLLYIDHLYRAQDTIETLESLLSICAYCKKIRKPNTDPRKIESWQTIETYFTEKMANQFSHGICPECYAKAIHELRQRDAIRRRTPAHP
ncbi:MAG: hypothetical protein NTX50_23340 [Candidatus Sumerlaeota bacterium]|nr:hypothetical protein [Candidatus Sumerlaeota bacterium]